MKLKIFPEKFAFAAVAALALSPFASADFEKYLPENGTFALVKVENADALRKHLREDAFASALKEKVFLPVAAALREAPETSGVFAAFSEEYAPARGECLFAVVADEETGFALVQIFECGNAFTLEKAVEMHRRQAAEMNLTPVIEDFEILGVPAKKVAFGDGTEGRGAVAVIDGKYFTTSTVPALEKIIAAVKGGNAAGLSASEVFRRARERIGDADAWIYADGNALAKAAYACAERFDKEQAAELEAHPENAMLTVLATPVVKAFAPEAVNSFWGKISYDESLGFTAETSLSWNEKKGIVTLLAGTLKDGFDRPAMFPQLADASSFSASSFSFGALALNMMAIARQASPLFGIADMQLLNLKMTKGLDVPAALAALGDGAVVYSVAPAGAPEKMLVAQKVSDGALVLDSVRKLAALAGGEDALSSEETPAGTVFSLRGEGGSGASFAVIDGWFCFGEKELLARVAEKAAGGNAPSVWDDEDLKAGEALLPDGGSGISGTHAGRSAASALAALREVLGGGKFAAAADSVANASGADFSSARLCGSLKKISVSPSDLDFFIVSKTYLSDGELTSKAVVVPKK